MLLCTCTLLSHVLVLLTSAHRWRLRRRRRRRLRRLRRLRTGRANHPTTTTEEEKFPTFSSSLMTTTNGREHKKKTDGATHRTHYWSPRAATCRTCSGTSWNGLEVDQDFRSWNTLCYYQLLSPRPLRPRCVWGLTWGKKDFLGGPNIPLKVGQAPAAAAKQRPLADFHQLQVVHAKFSVEFSGDRVRIVCLSKVFSSVEW